MDIEERKTAEKPGGAVKCIWRRRKRLSQDRQLRVEARYRRDVGHDETYRIFDYDRSVKATNRYWMRASLPAGPAPPRRSSMVSRGGDRFEHAYRFVRLDGPSQARHAMSHYRMRGDRELSGCERHRPKRKTTED